MSERSDWFAFRQGGNIERSGFTLLYTTTETIITSTKRCVSNRSFGFTADRDLAGTQRMYPTNVLALRQSRV